MYLYALLGLLQGLTEFLPVSSSGHLVLAERLLGLDPPGVVLEAVLHLATLCAVLIYFRRDLARLIIQGITPAGAAERRYLGLLILGTLPIVIVGLIVGLSVRREIEQAFSSVPLIGGMLVLTGVILWAAAHLQSKARRAQVGMRDAIYMGLAQAAALLPGISRAGATIGAGIASGLVPKAAARFSFLLSIPAIFGAAVLALAETKAPIPAGEAWGLVVGGSCALISGLLAIHLLLKLLFRGRLDIFAFYCLTVGMASLTAGLLL